MALSGPMGAASIVRARSVRELVLEDEGIGVDVDTLDALAAAERALRARRLTGPAL
jgi:molybdenum cofactor cytidylyltransferase